MIHVRYANYALSILHVRLVWLAQAAQSAPPDSSDASSPEDFLEGATEFK